MGMSERDKMAAGEWYSCLDPEFDEIRNAARSAVPFAQYNASG